jgi:integrase
VVLGNINRAKGNLTMARKQRGWGEGGIHYRESEGRFEVFVPTGKKPNGKYGRLKAYVKTKKEATAKLHELREKVRKGLPTVSVGKMTLAAFLAKWLEGVKPSVEPTTYAQYELLVRLHIVPIVGTVQLSKLIGHYVRQLYTELAKLGASPAMRKKTGTTLYMALKQAVKEGLLSHNPCEDVERPKAERPEFQVYDLGQVTQFRDAAKADRLFALYLMAIDTGMRQGELFALQWADIDFEAGAVLVRRSLQNVGDHLRLKVPKSKKGQRRIDLAPITLEALREHRERMRAEGLLEGPPAGAMAQGFDTLPVFCDTRGGYLRKSNFHRHSFQPIFKRSGLPRIRFHDLRHTCATLLLLADESSKVVSERLGHSRTGITDDLYTHVLPSLQKRAAKKMHALLSHGTKVHGPLEIDPQISPQEGQMQE